VLVRDAGRRQLERAVVERHVTAEVRRRSRAVRREVDVDATGRALDRPRCQRADEGEIERLCPERERERRVAEVGMRARPREVGRHDGVERERAGVGMAKRRGELRAALEVAAAQSEVAVGDVVHGDALGVGREREDGRGGRAGQCGGSGELARAGGTTRERAEGAERYGACGERRLRRSAVEGDLAARGDALAPGREHDAIGRDGRVDADDGRLRELPDRPVARCETDLLHGRRRACGRPLDRRANALGASVCGVGRERGVGAIVAVAAPPVDVAACGVRGTRARADGRGGEPEPSCRCPATESAEVAARARLLGAERAVGGTADRHFDAGGGRAGVAAGRCRCRERAVERRAEEAADRVEIRACARVERHAATVDAGAPRRPRVERDVGRADGERLDRDALAHEGGTQVDAIDRQPVHGGGRDGDPRRRASGVGRGALAAYVGRADRPSPRRGYQEVEAREPVAGGGDVRDLVVQRDAGAQRGVARGRADARPHAVHAIACGPDDRESVDCAALELRVPERGAIVGEPVDLEAGAAHGDIAGERGVREPRERGTGIQSGERGAHVVADRRGGGIDPRGRREGAAGGEGRPDAGVDRVPRAARGRVAAEVGPEVESGQQRADVGGGKRIERKLRVDARAGLDEAGCGHVRPRRRQVESVDADPPGARHVQRPRCADGRERDAARDQVERREVDRLLGIRDPRRRVERERRRREASRRRRVEERARNAAVADADPVEQHPPG
jgi:hypothetical protein